jgi:hypothetical protein
VQQSNSGEHEFPYAPGTFGLENKAFSLARFVGGRRKKIIWKRSIDLA